jgi:hypothetical protein
MATSAKLARDTTHFYVWNALGDFVSVQLSIDVVEKLTKEHLRAAQDHPPGDISGVLLGRSLTEPRRALTVEDLALAVGNEKNESPSSRHDAVRDMVWKLVRGAESGQHVVGFFRSQRDGPLVTADLVLELSQNGNRLFGERDSLLLLVRFPSQGESEATFFYWKHGGINPLHSGPDFLFDVAKLSATGNIVRKHTHPGLPNEAPQSPEKPSQVAAERRVGLRLLPTFAIFVLATIGTMMLWQSSSQDSTPRAQTLPRDDESTLGLKVTAQSHQLDIRWNHHSIRILAAEKALIRITDGARSEIVPVTREELRDGYLVYTPQTNDVHVYFEVSGSDAMSATESLRVVAIP